MTWKTISKTNPLPIQLTGRNVVDAATTHNAVEIRDTNLDLSSAVEVSAYKKIIIEVSNTLDNASNNADPKIMLFDSTNNGIRNGDGSIALITLSYVSYSASGSRIILDDTQVPALRGCPFSIKIGVQASNIPTIGSIIVVLRGVPN